MVIVFLIGEMVNPLPFIPITANSLEIRQTQRTRRKAFPADERHFLKAKHGDDRKRTLTGGLKQQFKEETQMRCFPI